MRRKVSILGSTGSIGTQTLNVISQNREDFLITGLAAGSNITLLLEQIRSFTPKIVSVYNEADYIKLKDTFNGTDIKFVFGDEGNIEVALYDEPDVVVAGIVGTRGLLPVYEAVKAGKTVALANKESLVVAGRLLTDLMKKSGAKIIPVDSEHSAIFQALDAGNRNDVKKILLTASGGPFLNKTSFENVTIADTLSHPTWNMGKKVTVDSATMFNKGLEIIEARWLFNVEPNKIEVVIHPQSIVHSMVEFSDGNIIAQMGAPDMRIPISYSLYYPNRWENKDNDFTLYGKKLEFLKPDFNKYSSLPLAYRVMEYGDAACFAYSQANEVAVRYFLDEKISFVNIFEIVDKVVSRFKDFQFNSISDIIKMEENINRETKFLINSLENI